MAYFRALAAAPSEQSSGWRCTLAGLVAMRLIDAWATEERLPDPGLRALERAINMMDVDAMEREPLRALREALLLEARGRTSDEDSHVLERVREYGEALWLTAEWTLASDACRTIIRHARTASERAIAPLAYSRLGHCLLARGRQDAAMEAFQTGRSFASSRGDLRSDLALRIAEATVEIHRGNYLGAECILDEVIAEATFAALPDVRARAMHDRGGVAYRRGDTDRALTLYFRALDEYGTDVGADRVLADIGLAVLEFGHRDIAREVLQILERESVEQVQRWAATINLMRIAALDDNEPLFDGYRRTLSRVRLPARQRAYYHLFASQGWLKFDQPLLSRRELLRAEQAVCRYRLTELDEELSNALSALELMSAKREAGEIPALLSLGRESTSAATPGLLRLIDQAPAAAKAWQSGRRSTAARNRLAAGATA
jgi:tetratricopeptide (TPR) repeat protein